MAFLSATHEFLYIYFVTHANMLPLLFDNITYSHRTKLYFYWIQTWFCEK